MSGNLDLSRQRVLVTGAGGFIGSHLVEALVRRGASVRAMVHYNSANSAGWLDTCSSDVRGQFEIVAGDIRDPHGMATSVAGCDVVFHLAALIAIPYSYHSPDSYVETNIRGTLNVLQAARAHGVQRIVQTSTSEVYGTAQSVPMTESHPIRGQSPYAATKIGADQLALSFYRSFGTPVAVVRPFNTYGPRQSLRAVVPTIVLQLIDGGGRIKLGATDTTRDLSFVTDTVEGMLAIGSAGAAVGEEIQIASGFEVSIGEIARMAGEIIGCGVEIEVEDKRLRPEASEVNRLFACVEKAERLLNWRPELAGKDGFRKGLERTIAWFREPSNRALYKAERFAL